MYIPFDRGHLNQASPKRTDVVGTFARIFRLRNDTFYTPSTSMNTDNEVAVLIADIKSLQLAPALVCPHCNEAVDQALVESHLCNPLILEELAALAQLRLLEQHEAGENDNGDELQRFAPLYVAGSLLAFILSTNRVYFDDCGCYYGPPDHTDSTADELTYLVSHVALDEGAGMSYIA